MKNNLSQQDPLPSLKDFLSLWQNTSDEDGIKDYSHYIKSNPLLENLLSLGPCFVYMLNYKTMKYIYMSNSIKNILGYNAEEVIKTGPDFFFRIIHPDDLNELMNNTFKKMLEFYYSSPIDERKKIRCTYDYRVKRSDGKFVRLLQQTLIVETDNNGYPLVDIGIISDITEYKKENKINLSLSKYDQESGFTSPGTEVSSIIKKDRISERELEILNLLMKGNSSKNIANKLNISVNTVRNHRQNLMGKTKTKNIAELISFALSNSLL
jgi:PAS domain S-box-containing protein